MKGKIIGWIFIVSAVGEIIVNAPRIWEIFKMIDKALFLEMVLLIILIGSGSIYVVEKYKRLKKWIGRFEFKHAKGSYSDLKGKIKFYIREELEELQLQKSSSENSSITIRQIGDQTFQSLTGEALIKKWNIQPHTLLNIYKKQYMKVYTPEEGVNNIANETDQDIEGNLAYYSENNETDEDAVLHFKFKPTDIRLFEEKISKKEIPGFVLKKGNS